MTLATALFGTLLRLDHAGTESAVLSSLGLHPGDDARVVGAAPFGGPLLVELPVAGVRIAVARQRAAGIPVRLAE